MVLAPLSLACTSSRAPYQKEKRQRKEVADVTKGKVRENAKAVQQGKVTK